MIKIKKKSKRPVGYGGLGHTEFPVADEEGIEILGAPQERQAGLEGRSPGGEEAAEGGGGEGGLVWTLVWR